MKCRKCIFSKFKKGKSILDSGYICYKNPFKPKSMGWNGGCYINKIKTF